MWLNLGRPSAARTVISFRAGRCPRPAHRSCVEQVLLGLADRGYVLSTPDGVVAECGVSVVALLGAQAERLAGRPVANVLDVGRAAAARRVRAGAAR